MSQNGDNKSDVNELETKIIQQIEYYFSDINLSRDKFLKEVIAKDSGWVPIQTLLTFNRLKSLSDDKSVVINALKKSVSNLLEISEDEEKIKRCKPLPEFDEKYTQELNERTVHIKGFPEDTKLDDVMKFCNQFGAIENIEMRRFFKTKKFKGCIFVTFINKEDAQKVIDANEVKYGNNDKNLLRENKISYFARKKEWTDKKGSKKGKSDGKKTKEEDEEAKEDGETEENNDEEAEPKAEAVSSVKTEAAIMKLKGVDENTKFTAIKDFFKKYGFVSYVEDVKDNQSFVRFGDKEGAKIALEKIKSEQNSGSGDVKSEQNDNSDDPKIESEPNADSSEVKINIEGNEVVIEVLTGDEEKKFWDEFEKNRLANNKKRSQKKKDFNKGKKGRNMWQRGRKRGYQGKGDRDAKRQRAEQSD